MQIRPLIIFLEDNLAAVLVDQEAGRVAVYEARDGSLPPPLIQHPANPEAPFEDFKFAFVMANWKQRVLSASEQRAVLIEALHTMCVRYMDVCLRANLGRQDGRKFED